MKVIYQVPVPATILPCGYKIEHAPFVNGRMNELSKHYRECPHKFCQWRLRVRGVVGRKVRAGIVRK